MKFRKEENQGHNLYFKAAVLEVVQSAEAIRLPLTRIHDITRGLVVIA